VGETPASFISQIEQRLPVSGQASRLTLETPVAALTRVERVALLQAVESLTGAPTERISQIETVEDAYELFLLRKDAGTLPRASLLDLDSYRHGAVGLRPLGEADFQIAYQASIDPRHAHQWRYRGASPDPRAFVADLYEGVLVQHLVTGAFADRPVGLVVGYRYDAANQHCYVAFQRWDWSDSRGEMLTGIALFLQYLFDHWPLRHIYAEVPEYNWAALDGLEALANQIALLPDHLHWKDEWVGLGIYRISREPWAAFMDTWSSPS
jgi:hypothetical protein